MCIRDSLPTPRKLAVTRGVVNIKNSQDEMCFLWSVLAHIHPKQKQKESVSKYTSFINTLNMSGIEYPVSIDSLSKFETQNPNISVNVFGYDIEDNIRNESKNEVYPLRITPNKDRLHHVNLLLLSDTNSRKHYCLISNMSRLLSSLTKHDGQSFYCDYCLHRFSTGHGLSDHLPYCTPSVSYTHLPPVVAAVSPLMFPHYSVIHPYTVYRAYPYRTSCFKPIFPLCTLMTTSMDDHILCLQLNLQ